MRRRTYPSNDIWRSGGEPGIGYNIIGLTTANFSYGNTQQTTTMVYDSTGSRTKKQAAGSTTVYLGKDYEVEGSTTTKHIFLGDRRISTRRAAPGNTELYFIHSDHINSSNVVTDASGNQSILLEYDPYGETVTQTGSADLKHKYTGQERDDSSHLYYYGARYYDPQIGRFVTADWVVQDPGDPQSLNRYAYARNNPIVYTDPTGNFWWFIAAIIAVVKAAVAATTVAYGAVASFMGGIVGALGIKGALASFLTHVMAGAAIGGAIGGLDAAATGRSFGGGALSGTIGGAIGGGVLGPSLSLVGKMGVAPLEYALRTGIGGFGAYRAIAEKRFTAGTFAIVGTLHPAAKLQDSIARTVAGGPSKTEEIILKAGGSAAGVDENGNLIFGKGTMREDPNNPGIFRMNDAIAEKISPTSLGKDPVSTGFGGHIAAVRDEFYGIGHITTDKGVAGILYHQDAHQAHWSRPISSLAHGIDFIQSKVTGHVGPGQSVLSHPALMAQALNVNNARRAK